MCYFLKYIFLTWFASTMKSGARHVINYTQKCHYPLQGNQAGFQRAVLIAKCVNSESLWWWSGYASVMADDSQFREWTQLAAPCPQFIKAGVILFILSVHHLSVYVVITLHSLSNHKVFFTVLPFLLSINSDVIISSIIFYFAGKTLSDDLRTVDMRALEKLY